jgi:hypothetical protein
VLLAYSSGEVVDTHIDVGVADQQSKHLPVEPSIAVPPMRGPVEL